MHRAAAAVAAILLLTEAVHCFPIRSRTGTENRSQERKVNGYIKGVYECLNTRTPLECCGLEACNIRATLGFEELGHNYSSGTTISIGLHFNTTFISQLVKQSTTFDLRAEMRVHKKLLSKDDILSLQSAGCNTSGIAIRLLDDEYNMISELVLTMRQLEVNEWVSFGNLSQMYNSWTTDTNRTMRSVRLDILASCRAIQPAFATAFGEELKPILVAYTSEPNMASFPRDVSIKRKIQRREVQKNASCGVYPYQINMSDYFPKVIAPLQVSAIFCAGSCDLAQPNNLNTNSWIHFSEHKRHPNEVRSLCCAPSGYNTISVIEQEAVNVLTLETMLNFNAAACQCV